MSDPKSGAETMQLLDTFVELFKERILASREDVSLLMTSSTGDDYDAIALTATTIKDVPKAEKKSDCKSDDEKEDHAEMTDEEKKEHAIQAIRRVEAFNLFGGRSPVDLDCQCSKCKLPMHAAASTLLRANAKSKKDRAAEALRRVD